MKIAKVPTIEDWSILADELLEVAWYWGTQANAHPDDPDLAAKAAESDAAWQQATDLLERALCLRDLETLMPEDASN
jgi:hypothetical protein